MVLRHSYEKRKLILSEIEQDNVRRDVHEVGGGVELLVVTAR